MKCSICGIENKDVEVVRQYPGGGAIEDVPQCRESVPCWNRYNRENGLPLYREKAEAL